MTTHANPRMFAQITKVDAAKREVWGRLAHEVPDRADEIFDYDSSKAHFQSWSDGFAKATDGKSLGNLRAMHGKTAAGKFIAINFNDAEKAIDVGAKVVDDNEWAKVVEGVYTGFSIGGSYVGERKAEKINGRDIKRYTAAPTEGSLVDSPCIPTAKFFDVVKADGVIEKVAFKDPVHEVQIAGTPEQVDELVTAMTEKKVDIAAVIALIKADPVTEHALVIAARELTAAADALGKAFDEAKDADMDALVAKALDAPALDALTKATPAADLVKAKRAAVVAKGVGEKVQKMHDMIGEMGAKCATTKGIEVTDLAKLTADFNEMRTKVEKLEKQPVPFVTLRTLHKGGTNESAEIDVSKITLDTLKPEQLIKNADGSFDYATSLAMVRQKALDANAALGNS